MKARRLDARWRIAAAAVVAAALAIGLPPIAGAGARSEIRVVTYNIRHSRGMDGRPDLTRTAGTLGRLAPDIVGLQEVDRGTERSARVHQADSLGRLLGLHPAFGAFMAYDGGEYGMAVLSRFPIRRTAPLRLPDGNEPRIALLVEVELGSGERILIVNVHFDWVADDGYRFEQATALAAVLDTIGLPVILLGDFNDQPGSRTIERFRARFAEAAKDPGARFTFPATDPAKEIDFIFAAPVAAWRVRSAEVIDDRMASDHRPVLAVLAR
ncbi:MAG: endonuclease/exonuclease/phosphatase family protein [Gemmatimonadaceae bacterium]